jgi:hypothetical protein
MVATLALQFSACEREIAHRRSQGAGFPSGVGGPVLKAAVHPCTAGGAAHLERRGAVGGAAVTVPPYPREARKLSEPGGLALSSFVG